jgi:uncharacterized protein (TIGR03000 family)
MSQLTRALAAVAAIAALGTSVGAQSARARDYPGPYDHNAGRYYSEESRDYVRMGYDGYGIGRAAEPRAFSPETRTYSYGGYPADWVSYYEGPLYVVPVLREYAYGAVSSPARSNTAHIRLLVPASAKVWFGNSATQQTGSVRFFESPALTPGKDYSYDVKAQWRDASDKEVTRTRHVDVRANMQTTVDLTASGSGT